MKKLSDLVPSSEILGIKAPLETTILEIGQRADAVKAGTLFFAIAGTRADGHSFAAKALEQGAAAVVVERREVFDSLPSAILVKSTRKAMGIAASRLLGDPTHRLALVGTTGTNGKTTISYLLNQIWEAAGVKCGLVGTVETRIAGNREESTLTTPDALELQKLFGRMVDAGVTHAAIEVSSIALDQQRTAGSRFAVGVFTNLTQDHLDYHGDMEAYYQAKLRFFREYDLPWAVINGDDEGGQRILRDNLARNPLSYGIENKADIWAMRTEITRTGTEATVRTPRGMFELRTPLIGVHNLYNCLAVLGAVYATQGDLAAAVRALETAPGAPGRLERAVLGAQYPNVFVDYAHTEDALENVLRALDELRGTSPGKLVTVFGCGGDRDRTKRPRMGRVASEWSDVTVATSDNPRTENPDSILDEIETGILKADTEYHREVNRRAAIEKALKIAGPEDLVLIAGKGHETYQILGTEKVPFDDRQVIRNYYGIL